MNFFGVMKEGKAAFCACFLILIIFVCVTLALGSLIIVLKRSSEGDSSFLWMSIGAVFVGLFFTGVFIGIYFKLKQNFVMSIRTGIWNINSKYYETSKCLIEFYRYDAGPILSLVRYDTSKCKEYLCMLLERRPNYDEEKRKELVDTLIEEKLQQFQISLFRNWLTIEESYLNVHNTWKNRKCLCQMLEKRLPCS
ncbi:uncharacterized protein [Mytilus edulis]|uniref:uncharacterized protein n=1 Tax=Mytilus edulis TaxID=6550 RepID=UPI0039EE51AB